MEETTVHPRISQRHPELSEQDVLEAWENCICARPRLDGEAVEYIAVGCDSGGRLIELIAKGINSGSWLIYHAFTPPTRKALQELGMVGR